MNSLGTVAKSSNELSHIFLDDGSYHAVFRYRISLILWLSIYHSVVDRVGSKRPCFSFLFTDLFWHVCVALLMPPIGSRTPDYIGWCLPWVRTKKSGVLRLSINWNPSNSSVSPRRFNNWLDCGCNLLGPLIVLGEGRSWPGHQRCPGGPEGRFF